MNNNAIDSITLVRHYHQLKFWPLPKRENVKGHLRYDSYQIIFHFLETSKNLWGHQYVYITIDNHFRAHPGQYSLQTIPSKRNYRKNTKQKQQNKVVTTTKRNIRIRNAIWPMWYTKTIKESFYHMIIYHKTTPQHLL